MNYVQQSVDFEMKEEKNLKTLENRFWVVWFYTYYFIEVEWERFVPFFFPVYTSFIINHFLLAYQAFWACCYEVFQIDIY